MNSYSHGMSKVTELTRLGKLTEATALIQSLLSPAAADAPSSDDGAIDGTFTRLKADPTPKAKPASSWRKPRTRLSETLRHIVAGGMPAAAPISFAEEVHPPGARFLSLTHSSPQGIRNYRLYVPAHPVSGPMPLIVMLHGCTQTPEDFAAGTGMNVLAEEFGCLIAYPAQPSGANAQKCWNWFRPEDQVRGKGEPALIAGLARDIHRDWPADPARTYVAGLSAGGAAAVLIAAAYPDVFAAAGVHSGLPAGSAKDVPSAFAAMRSGARGKPHRSPVPTIIFHGSADSTVHPSNGQAILHQTVLAMPGLRVVAEDHRPRKGRAARTTRHLHADGRSLAEHWEIQGAGHAWSGGHPSGSYTDASGPDASRQMLRFFLQHDLIGQKSA